MSSFSDDLNRLEKNINRLIEQKIDLKEKLNQARRNEQEMLDKLQRHQKIEEELREKNNILRIAGGQNDEGSREMKLKINEIVREVDKCIAQLNQ